MMTLGLIANLAVCWHLPYVLRHRAATNQASVLGKLKTLPRTGNLFGPGGRGRLERFGRRHCINRCINTAMTIVTAITPRCMMERATQDKLVAAMRGSAARYNDDHGQVISPRIDRNIIGHPIIRN